MDSLYSYYDYMDNQYSQSEVLSDNHMDTDYKTPYDMNHITPFVFSFICTITLLSIICCIAICYSISKAILKFGSNPLTFPTARGYSKQPLSRSLSTTSMVLTLICVLLYTGCNILDPIAYYTRFMKYNSDWNDIIYKLYNVLWICAKLSFYSVLIHRYYLLYNASYYTDPSLKSKKLCIFSCFGVILLLQLLLYIAIFLVYFEFIDQRVSNTDIMKCSSIMFLCSDILIVLLLGYLFTASVLKLVLQIQATKSKHVMFDKRQKSVTIDDTLQTMDEPTDTTRYSTHFNVDTLTHFSTYSDIFGIANMNKTNINLNANELSMLSPKQTLETADIQHRYRFTSSSMPDYNPT
eukprot:549271_1